MTSSGKGHISASYNPFHQLSVPPYFAPSHALEQYPYFSGFDPLTLSKFHQSQNAGSVQPTALEAQKAPQLPPTSLSSFYSGIYSGMTAAAAPLYAAHAASGIYTSSTSSTSPGSSPGVGNNNHNNQTNGNTNTSNMDVMDIRRPVQVIY